MSDGISVVIPVGPSPANVRWLWDAIESVKQQTIQPDIALEVVLIDDMAGLPLPDILQDTIRVWRTPWRVGVADAFNFGVALARFECVFMLGSDDWLEPDCLERCWKEYLRAERPEDAYFFVGVKYEDGREEDEQFTPCNAAMVTKGLWRLTGGFPPETGSGAPDTAFCSMFWNRPNLVKFIGVSQERPLYHYRPHGETDTAGRASWQGVILETRDLLTQLWEPPKWTERNAPDWR